MNSEGSQGHGGRASVETATWKGEETDIEINVTFLIILPVPDLTMAEHIIS